MPSALWAWAHGYHTGSVLPRIAGKHTPSGFEVVIDRTGRGELVSWGCAIAVFAAGIVLVILDLMRPHPQFGSDIAMITVGAGLIAAVRQLLVRRRFRKGTLRVTPWPIRLGEHVRAELYAFVAGEERAPAARVECIEQAISGRGTRYEQGKIATLYSSDLAPQALQWTEAKLHAVLTFDVPRECPPSFYIFDREILSPRERLVQWRVVVDIPTRGGESTAEFPLLVVPEVVP